MKGWIKCSEQMPSCDGYVLVKIAFGKVHLARYKDGVWLQDKEHCTSSGFISCLVKDRVTHWQPLPSPPEGA